MITAARSPRIFSDPKWTMLGESLTDHKCDGLESVLHFTDPFYGNESILFVFADQEPNLLDEAAYFTDAVPAHVVPLVLRRSELFQLLLPYPGPRQYPGAPLTQMTKGSLHLAAWAKNSGTIVHGQDIRAEIPSPACPVSALRHHLEVTSDIVRFSTILTGLSFRRSFVKELEQTIGELMLSALTAVGRPRLSPAQIVSEFYSVAPTECRRVVDDWRKFRSSAVRGSDTYVLERELKAAWYYEQFRLALSKFANSLPDDAVSGLRLQVHGDVLRNADSDVPVLHATPWKPDLSPFAICSTPEAPYGEIVDAGLDELNKISGDVLGFTLYGSIARRDAQPGKSDILDGVLVLHDSCFTTEERFTSALRGMMECCRRMTQDKVPFHPFKYCDAAEWTAHNLPTFLREWQSDSLSCMILGQDIRPYAGCSAIGRLFARRSMYTMPLLTRRCTRYLRRRELTYGEIRMVLDILVKSAKLAPRWLAAAGDRWLDSVASLEHVSRQFPGVDWTLIGEGKTIKFTGLNITPGKAGQLLRQLLGFVEDSCAALTTRLMDNGEWNMIRNV